jgi:hypothetical protein
MPPRSDRLIDAPVDRRRFTTLIEGRLAQLRALLVLA